MTIVIRARGREMTKSETLEHVLMYSCNNCENFKAPFGVTKAQCFVYEKCKAGQPLTAVPFHFVRKASNGNR